jgi:hypothetical protein
MASRRRGWGWAAGVLLVTSTAGPVAAQDRVQPPASTNAAVVSASFDRGPSSSPYFPISRETVSQAPSWAPATTVGTLPKADPVAGPVVSQSSCSFSADVPPWTVAAKPSWCSRVRHWLQDCFLGYREEFEAPPLGYFVYLHGETEVANGEAARMVLYHYDFVEGSDQLKPRGKYQLAKITALLPLNFNPVIIEATPEAPALDEARRAVVVRELAVGPFPVPAERVVIGRPLAIPLQGPEAERIYRNQLLNTEAAGLRAAGGVTAAPGAGTTGGGILAPSATLTGR